MSTPAEWAPTSIDTIPTNVHPTDLFLNYSDGMTVRYRADSDLNVHIKRHLKPAMPALGDAMGGHVLVALGIDSDNIDEVWVDGDVDVLTKVRQAIESLTRVEAALSSIADGDLTAAIDDLQRQRAGGTDR